MILRFLPMYMRKYERMKMINDINNKSGRNSKDNAVFVFFGSDKLCNGKQYGDSRYNGEQWFYTIVTDILRQLQVQAQGLYSAYNNHSYGCGWIIAAWGKACFYGIYVFYSDFLQGKGEC